MTLDPAIKPAAVEGGLVERLRNLANALIALRTGVTMEAAEALPVVDPVTVADALEEAADALASNMPRASEGGGV